jgi:hypothetical protein
MLNRHSSIYIDCGNLMCFYTQIYHYSINSKNVLQDKKSIETNTATFNYELIVKNKSGL